METKENEVEETKGTGGEEEEDAIELVLFQVPECYVYLIPPRKTAASYRADEWDVNKWVWEGVLKVVSKGEECIIRLEDKTTGELYARAFLRKGEPHPVETVIDSSRYFVLRIEEKIGGRIRHAFIGIGFRERTEAYDFQAALHDHMKYLDKKKTAEEMEQHFQSSSSADYSLKEGETLVLQLKNKSNDCVTGMKSKFFKQGVSNLSLEEKGDKKEPILAVIRPPPPPGTLSPVSTPNKSPSHAFTRSLSPVSTPNKSPSHAFTRSSPDGTTKDLPNPTNDNTEQNNFDGKGITDDVEEDFGDFQAAG